jgi:hypothetical protein
MLRRESKRLFINTNHTNINAKFFLASSSALYYTTPQAHLGKLYLQSNNPVFSTKSNGDTYLHEAISSETFTTKTLTKMVIDIGEETVSSMARTHNNTGSLPIDILKSHYYYLDDKNEIRSELLRLMKQFKIKKISEPINIDAVLASYYPHRSETFCRNVKIACEVANEVRTCIRESYTHPQTNDYSLEGQHALRKKIRHSRKQQDKETMAIMDTISIYDDKQLMLCELDNFMKQGKIALSEGFGNCSEFSSATWNILNEKYGDISSNAYYLVNGDHVIVSFGLENDVNFTNNTVFIDAWAGTACALDELPTKLSNYRQLRVRSIDNERTDLHVLTSYNPHFHYLESMLSSKAIQLQRSRKQAAFVSTTASNSTLFASKNKTVSEVVSLESNENNKRLH